MDRRTMSFPPLSNPLSNAALLAGRLLLAAIFVIEGWHKIAAYAATAGYMQQYGVPGVLLPLVIAVEAGGGLMVAAGWGTRTAALALAGFSLLAAVIFHGGLANGGQALHFWKDLAIAGGFLSLAVHGGGTWALGRARGRAPPPAAQPVS